MANPPHLFRVDGRLDELVLHIRPWSDDVVDKLGFDPRSSYVEDFWLPTLGPSTTWLLRRQLPIHAAPWALGSPPASGVDDGRDAYTL